MGIWESTLVLLLFSALSLRLFSEAVFKDVTCLNYYRLCRQKNRPWEI